MNPAIEQAFEVKLLRSIESDLNLLLETVHIACRFENAIQKISVGETSTKEREDSGKRP